MANRGETRDRHDSARLPPLVAALVVALFIPQASRAQVVVISEPAGETLIRRTDLGGQGAINPATQHLPRILGLTLGAYTPANPTNNLFSGDWSVGGAFMRIDVIIAGLVNPPGPVGLDDAGPQYDPMRYGPNPIIGWIELDMDANVNTGGEISAPQFRYLGNVARFGGLPSVARFANRIAEDASAFDGDVTTSPFVERSGEEFHLVFVGEDIDEIEVRSECQGGNANIFEAGETWDLEGRLLHRAHAFEGYAFSCAKDQGRYKPTVNIRFSHNTVVDRTLISLVYPLTNAASAAMHYPPQPVQANDGCDDNQNSVEEALTDLQFSAIHADPLDKLDAEYQLMAGWEFADVQACLHPESWQLTALVGTPYALQPPDGARFVWTDVWPKPRVGDFDGDGQRGPADGARLAAYIASHNGMPGYDDDGNSLDGHITLHQFAQNFSLFDTNYDGRIESSDVVLLGDMDINGVVNLDDVDDFVLALLSPSDYAATHGGASPLWRGDVNGDGLFDGHDVQGFLALLH